MIWHQQAHGIRVSQYVFVLAVAGFGAIPQQTIAAQVQAYAMFELAPSANASATVEKLRSTSLSNCLQLVIGSHARDVVVHIACDERGADTSFLNQAVLTLSGVDGVSRATIVSLKLGAT